MLERGNIAISAITACPPASLLESAVVRAGARGIPGPFSSINARITYGRSNASHDVTWRAMTVAAGWHPPKPNRHPAAYRHDHKKMPSKEEVLRNGDDYVRRLSKIAAQKRLKRATERSEKRSSTADELKTDHK